MSVDTKPAKSVRVDPALKPALKALNAFIKDSTSSAEAAAKSLKKIGILDSKGRLHKRYRS
ncbi:MAG: hypothetical protein M5U26_06425 [Planctomycetota bacterium]|nr:hypothetical protein [Planctomycetota bacterium]